MEIGTTKNQDIKITLLGNHKLFNVDGVIVDESDNMK